MNCKSMFCSAITGAFLLSFVVLARGEGTDAGPISGRRPAGSVAMEARQSAHYRRPMRIFEKMLSDKGFVKDIGLSDEAVKNLQKNFEMFRDKEKDLQGKKMKAQREQMKLMAEAMASFSPMTNAAASTGKASFLPADKLRKKLLSSFVETEAIQHELNLLAVDRMMLIRENLTDEQLVKASDSIHKHLDEQKRHVKERKERFLKRQREKEAGQGKHKRGKQKEKKDVADEAHEEE